MLSTQLLGCRWLLNAGGLYVGKGGCFVKKKIEECGSSRGSRFRKILSEYGSVIKLSMVLIALACGTSLVLEIVEAVYGRSTWGHLMSVLPPGFSVLGAFRPSALVSVGVLIALFVAYLGLTYYREVKLGFDVEGVIRSRKRADVQGYRFREVPSVVALKKMLTDNAFASEAALASWFLTACLTPQETYACIDERVETNTRSLKVTSFISFKIPYNFCQSSFVIPAFFHRRGDYPDSLEVVGSSSDRIRLLNLEESFGYIKTVVAQTLPDAKMNRELWREIVGFIGGAESMTVEAVKTRCDHFAYIKAEIDKLKCSSRKSDDRKQLVIALLSQLIEAYPICLCCKAVDDKSDNVQNDEGHRLRYRASHLRAGEVTVVYRLPLVSVSGRWREGEDRLKKKFAELIQRPNTIYYGLGNADRTQSYHFQAIGPADSFCTVLALRRVEAPVRKDETASGRASREQLGVMGFPEAEMAYAQTRCGQRHLSLCAKNGRGFSNWFLMYRHAPRHDGMYRLAFIASVVVAAMMWVYLDCVFGLPRHEGDGASAVIVALIAAVASIAAVWASGGNRGARGGEVAPAAASLLVSMSAGLTMVYLAMKENLYVEGLVIVAFAVLASTCIVFGAREAAWFTVRRAFRKEEEPSVNLITEEEPDETTGLVWSPGWLAVDGNRYIDVRKGEGAVRDQNDEYKQNPRFVRDVFCG